MKTAAQAIHPLREFGKSKINNAQVARALSEYLGAANPSGNIRREHIFLRAPHWHNTCNCRCNGRKHETSRTPHLVCNLVSVASRAASRRVLPGLWRTGRPATAPSPGERDGRAGGRVRPAGRAANIHRDGQQHDKYSRELEREWNTRRERDGWNGRRGRRLLGPCESSCARFGVRAGHQRGGLLKDFGLGRADRERHFRLGLSRGGPARTRRHQAVLSHGEFSRQSQSSRRLDAFRQRMHGSRVRNRGFLRDVHGAADSYFPARRFPDRHKRGRSIQESHRDHYRHEFLFPGRDWADDAHRRRHRHLRGDAHARSQLESEPGDFLERCGDGLRRRGLRDDFPERLLCRACGSIDSTGLYTAPSSPVLVDVVATSSEDITQSGSAIVTINNSPGIFSLAPTSAYAGSAGGFTLLITGSNFSPSTPGPGSMILVTGAPRATACASSTQCITSLNAADLQSAGNLSVQLQNPDGLLSNSQTFIVLAPGSGSAPIPLTPSAPSSTGDDIVVVDLSTNGGSRATGNVSLNIAAIGAFSVATSACLLGGSPVIIQRPASGTGTADLCVFSVSALEPSFTYTIGGPPTPDITVINREPLGLGMLHLTLQVPATAAPGPRTLFVENPEKDKAAGSGAIEVR